MFRKKKKRVFSGDGSGRPFWSIAVLRAHSLDEIPEKVSRTRPCITPSFVTDRKISFVADPFLFPRSSWWYLFFEAFDTTLNRGVILAARSEDLVAWDYLGTALEEPFHLSYPFVFEWEGRIFMIPESRRSRKVTLYESTSDPGTDFWSGWKPVTTLLRGKYKDCSLFFDQGRWWMLAGAGAYSLKIFYADTPLGPWRRHLWPWIRFEQKRSARPGGRPFHYHGRLIRFAQDSVKHYGHQLRAFQIDHISPVWFRDHELSAAPFLSSGNEMWRREGMHHIDVWPAAGKNAEDAVELVVAVDGEGYGEPSV